jgi:hypothetical protein
MKTYNRRPFLIIVMIALISMLFLTGFDSPHQTFTEASGQVTINGLVFGFDCGADIFVRITNERRVDQVVLTARTDSGQQRQITVRAGETKTLSYLNFFNNNANDRLHFEEAGVVLLTLPPCGHVHTFHEVEMQFDCVDPQVAVSFRNRSSSDLSLEVSVGSTVTRASHEEDIHVAAGAYIVEAFDPVLLEVGEITDLVVRGVIRDGNGTEVTWRFADPCSNPEPAAPEPTPEPTPGDIEGDPIDTTGTCNIQPIDAKACTFAVTSSGNCSVPLELVCPGAAGAASVAIPCSLDSAGGGNASDIKLDPNGLLHFLIQQPDPKCGIKPVSALTGAAGGGSWLLPAAAIGLALIGILGTLGWQRAGKRRDTAGG